MCIGIQDMRLDLMKSLVGDTVSAERLKKSKLPTKSEKLGHMKKLLYYMSHVMRKTVFGVL